MKRFARAASALALGIFAVGTTGTVVKAQTAGWSGSYGGITGGYGWGSSSQTDPGIPAPLVPEEEDGDGHYKLNGGTLGGTLGYNWQKAPAGDRGTWVYGAEGDFSWADISGHSDVCGAATATPHLCSTRLNALDTFRGRIGRTFGDTNNWLFYGTGGLAIGELHGYDALTPAMGTDWRAGWTLGAGIETAFAPHWSAKLEYLHVDLGNGNLFNIVPGVAESVSFRSDIIRAGINYHFGDPVSAAPFYTKAPKLYAKALPLAGDPWSGWYGGVNAGYVDGSGKVRGDGQVVSIASDVVATAMAAANSAQVPAGQGGFIGGVQIGFNRLISPKLLAGLEADIQGSSLRGNGSASTLVPISGGSGTFVTTLSASRGLDYIGTVRARLGAEVTPAALLYVTGGLAYGEVKSSTTINQSVLTGNPPPSTSTIGSFSALRAGYTVGAGGEWMFMSRWSAKLEYLYYDLGTANYGTGVAQIDEGPTSLPGFGIDAAATTSHVHFNGNIVRAGLNYHFDGLGTP